MGKGTTTGSIGKGLPTSMFGGAKKTQLGFPCKGRKAFVPPQKIVEKVSDSEEEEVQCISSKQKPIAYGKSNYSALVPVGRQNDANDARREDLLNQKSNPAKIRE